MKNTFPIYLAAFTCLTLLACSPEDPRASAPASEEQASEQPTNRIEIPATVRSNLGITFSPVERRRVDSTIRVPGAFELQPLARHEYRLSLPGQVELRVNQYQQVEAGEILFRFKSPQWPELQHEIIEGEQQIDTAQADIAVAQAAITETDQRVKRINQRLASLAEAAIKNAELETQAAEIEATLPRLRAELEQARTKLANAQRTREHALHRASTATGIDDARLTESVDHKGGQVLAYQTIDWIEVRATRSGVVEKLALTDGAFAQAPSLVLSTIDPKQVRFRAMALQSDLVRINNGAEAAIIAPVAASIQQDGSVDATVTIGLEAHPQQRTVPLVAVAAEHREWIRPGVSAFLEVTVQTTGGPALAIPRAAILKDGIVHVFFRRDPADPNKAIRVEADMGISDGRWVVINSGLSLNDEVVLNGAYELKLASQQNGSQQKGGHFHADGTFHEEDH